MGIIGITITIFFDYPCDPSDVIIENKTDFLVSLGDLKK